MGKHSLRKATRIRARDPWHLINIFGLQLHFISISSVTVRAKTRANRKLIISSARHSLSLILGFCHVSCKEKRGLRLGPGRAGDSSLLSHVPRTSGLCLGLSRHNNKLSHKGRIYMWNYFFANNFKKRSIFILFKNTSRNKSLWIIVTINSVKLNNQFQSLYDSEVIDISIH